MIKKIRNIVSKWINSEAEPSGYTPASPAPSRYIPPCEKPKTEEQLKKESRELREKISDNLRTYLKKRGSSKDPLYGVSDKVKIDSVEFKTTRGTNILGSIVIHAEYNGEKYKAVRYSNSNGVYLVNPTHISNSSYFDTNSAINEIIKVFVKRSIDSLKELAVSNDCELVDTTGQYSHLFSSFILSKYSKDRTRVDKVSFKFMTKDSIEDKLRILKDAILGGGDGVNG